MLYRKVSEWSFFISQRMYLFDMISWLLTSGGLDKE